ncbi:MAG: DUF4835 family protein [Bacteroides sp.]|nr:DUF4835 family protein [Barnesiella sp.]MBD5253463.1 DUF4835 family protein [Barnesiella sp.]MBD5344215.1 DUF4835 family protein [Bacteroides sp.]MBD5368874.1 DUF4835 family protein [Bacteroides sp.]MDE5828949.1 DUF4835 family protein [Duncaniella sp.]
MMAAGADMLAQELNCRVEVNSDQIQGTNKQVFATLQSALNDYVNTTRWTNASFSPNEKIECTIFLTVKEYDEGSNLIKGDLQVQAVRPVYNSSYLTTLLNFKDTRVEFTYQENEPLIYSETTMESNLTALFNYYVYLILAIDFDSFQLRGGDPYWEKVASIVQMGQSSGETGWKAFEDTKNRAAVLAAYTDPATSVLRDLNYEFHLKGLDQMSVSPDKGRQTITQTLDNLTAVYKANPMSVGLSMFRDAKLDELVNIYSKAPSDERETAYKILQPLYPTDQDRLEKIKRGDETN